MAESFEKTKRIAGIFADEYNTENSTNYQWDAVKSFQPGEPYDFMLFDEDGRKLGAQLVEAVGSERTEKQIPAETARVIEAFKQRVVGSVRQGIAITLILRVIPPRNELDALISNLGYLLQIKLGGKPHSMFFEYDSSDDWLLDEVRQYVKIFSVLPLPGHRGVQFAYNYWPDEPSALFDDEQRVMNSARKKEKKYNDILIVIDSGESPVADMYIPIIKESMRDVNLKEVWVVDDFTIPPPRAFRVK